MSQDFGKYLYHSTDRIVEIYESLNQYAIKEIVRRLVKTGYLNKVATNLIYKMQESGMTMQSIMEDVAAHSGMSMKEVRKAFEDAAIEASKEDTETYRQAGLEQNSILTSEVMKNALKTAMLQTNNELRNMTRTMAGKSQRIFIEAVDEVYMKVQSGMCTYETAIAEAIMEVSKNGLYVKYPSGRRDTIETAVRRALMTGLNQGTMRMKIEKMKEMGQDLLVTSQHIGARTGGKFPYEDHSKWQGKVFSLSGKSDKYPSFVEACGWGKGGGIGGWNCRHHIYAYIEGISKLPEPIDEEENRRVEELNKKQRRYESSIRAKKRELLGLKEGMETTDSDKLKFELQQQYDRSAYELRELNKNYNDFCSDNNLKTWNERKKVVDFQREQSYEARLGADRYKKTAEYSLDESNKRIYMARAEIWKSRLKEEKLEKSVVYDTIDLSKSEQYAINQYVSFESYVINDVLRNNGVLSELQQEMVNNLDSALKKMPYYKGNLSRSLYFGDKSAVEDFAKKLKVGEKITFPEYVSTTYSEELYNADGEIQIYIHNSKKGRSIVGYNKKEFEVLYERNSSFKVLNKTQQNGKYFILLEEV